MFNIILDLSCISIVGAGTASVVVTVNVLVDINCFILLEG
jgi:hypothetical protein